MSFKIWCACIIYIVVSIIYTCIVKGNGKMTPIDARKGLLWPLLFLSIFTFIINDFIKYLLLIFGFYYGETSVYKTIDRWATSIIF